VYICHTITLTNAKENINQFLLILMIKATIENYSYKMIIGENKGWEMLRIIEIQKYPCKGKQVGDERGDCVIIRELNASLNIQITNNHYEDCERNIMKFNECLENPNINTLINTKHRSHPCIPSKPAPPAKAGIPSEGR